MKPGRLYLIPSNLTTPFDPAATLPAAALAVVRRLTDFVVEDAKTSRAFLKACGTDAPLQSISMTTLNEHTPAAEVEEKLAPVIAGRDLGLLSDAGAPGVADPGALLVAAAHRSRIEIVPLVGPSSLLLALMGAGFNGQRFTFQGYLPAERNARVAKLKDIERESAQLGLTQIFIETPYRNAALFADIVATCKPGTRLCVAADLTAASQFLHSLPIADWKQRPPPGLNKRPTVFLLLG
ncbi:MAG: SAM-dependent methyltransferase [Betaproteobacteria bacterium]|nr:SAM-dependent methyltransferase [Betaproteobacteria bacterium]